MIGKLGEENFASVFRGLGGFGGGRGVDIGASRDSGYFAVVNLHHYGVR